MTREWAVGCGGSLRVVVIVSLRFHPQASTCWPVFGVLADYVRATQSPWTSLCARRRLLDVGRERLQGAHAAHTRTHRGEKYIPAISPIPQGDPSREARTSMLISAPGRRYC